MEREYGVADQAGTGILRDLTKEIPIFRKERRKKERLVNQTILTLVLTTLITLFDTLGTSTYLWLRYLLKILIINQLPLKLIHVENYTFSKKNSNTRFFLLQKLDEGSDIGTRSPGKENDKKKTPPKTGDKAPTSPKDGQTSSSSSTGPIKPEETKGETSSKTESEDGKVKKDAEDLKKEVEKLEWKKTNFEAFDAASIKGITGYYYTFFS